MHSLILETTTSAISDAGRQDDSEDRRRHHVRGLRLGLYPLAIKWVSFLPCLSPVGEDVPHDMVVDADERLHDGIRRRELAALREREEGE